MRASSLIIAALVCACATTGSREGEARLEEASGAPGVTSLPDRLAPQRGEDPPDELAEPSDRLVFQSRQAAAGVRPRPARSYRVETMQLNFVGVPAGELARLVINEALGEPVAVVGLADEPISLTAPRPVPTREAVAALTDALEAAGLRLAETGTGFLVTRLGEAEDERGTPAGDVRVIEIANTTPSALADLVRPVVPGEIELRPDDGRGVVVLSGAGPALDDVEAALRRFDAPRLSGRTYGLFALRNTQPDLLERELLSVLEASGSGSVIETIPLPRLGFLFVSARTQGRFEEVREWIARLDVPPSGDERTLHYYAVQNTPADVLANQLRAVFTGVTRSASSEGAVPGPPERRGQASGGVSSGSAGAGSSAISIVPDELNNGLIVMATEAEFRQARQLLERMDVLPPQVLIEATIAEVTLNDDLRFGVRWFFEEGKGAVVLSDAANGAVGPVFPGLSATYFDGVDVGIAIDLLASVTEVSVLSAPSIMVQNNQTASLQVGDEVPIITQQAQAITAGDTPIISTVQLRSTGVLLDVKPRINASDMVVLEVQQEVSDVAPSRFSGVNTPTIQQRQFASTVSVRNGGTIALGGLIRETVTESDSGVPILRRLPVAGSLFRSQNDSRRRTELIVFLTPRIVRNPEQADDALRILTDKLTAPLPVAGSYPASRGEAR